MSRTYSTDPQENQLILRSIAGDRNAFGQLVARYQRLAVSIAYRMVGQSDVAEDVAQEAFVKAWLNSPRFRGDCTFRTWLGRIVVNATIDETRRSRPQASLDESLEAGGESAPAAVLRGERQEVVRRAILALPAQSRAALVLREYQELSYKEIAEMLDIPIGTVMSRLSYARCRLRELLEPELFPPTEAAGPSILKEARGKHPA